MSNSDVEFVEEEELLEDLEDDDLPPEEEDTLDELSKEFVKKLVDRCIQFMTAWWVTNFSRIKCPLHDALLSRSLLTTVKKLQHWLLVSQESQKQLLTL